MFKSINDSLRILPDVNMVRCIHEGLNKTRLSPREVDIQLKELCHFYLDLKDLLKMLNELFSLAILLVLIMQFSQLTVNMYTLFINISGKWLRLWTLHCDVLIILPGWLILRLIQMFSVINICDFTCREANRKAIVLHELWASKRPEGYKDMLKNLSIQLLQQPVEINLCNSIQLNHQLIQKVNKYLKVNF
ncbi:uncharacterized protein [Chelonus insularis]|uniref:uncharacterized protein n=1 Tax=Chelonus insularis TaxID=460826 RepID=UPI00158CF783|nr:uncharacterized protein LOC118068631 [Chelonus insularis]